MNNKVNYTLVGFLVFFGIALMIGFSYWLLKPTKEDTTKNYLIFFDESVLGLNVDSLVKYRGVNVGKVTRISISSKNSEQVEVLITILKTTPIKEKTVAKLTSQGITGLSYINLTLGDKNAPLLTIKGDEQYPIIKTVPSLFENIEKSMGTVSSRLLNVLTKTENLLNDKNQEQISLVLKRAASFMEKMENLVDKNSIKEIHNLIINSNNMIEKAEQLIPNIDNFVKNSIKSEDNLTSSISSIATSYLAVRGAMTQIEEAVTSGQFNLKKITQDTIPTMNNSLMEMENLMIKIEEAISKYQKSPADILFKTQEIKKGPGE